MDWLDALNNTAETVGGIINTNKQASAAVKAAQANAAATQAQANASAMSSRNILIGAGILAVVVALVFVWRK